MTDANGRGRHALGAASTAAAAAAAAGVAGAAAVAAAVADPAPQQHQQHQQQQQQLVHHHQHQQQQMQQHQYRPPGCCEHCGGPGVLPDWEAKLGVAVCAGCSKRHERLISKTNAKAQFLLSDADLAGLGHLERPNPHNDKYAAMKQLLLRSVEAVALRKHGSLAALEEEKQARMRGKLDRRLQKRVAAEEAAQRRAAHEAQVAATIAAYAADDHGGGIGAAAAAAAAAAAGAAGAAADGDDGNEPDGARSSKKRRGGGGSGGSLAVSHVPDAEVEEEF